MKKRIYLKDVKGVKVTPEVKAYVQRINSVEDVYVRGDIINKVNDRAMLSVYYGLVKNCPMAITTGAAKYMAMATVEQYCNDKFGLRRPIEYYRAVMWCLRSANFPVNVYDKGGCDFISIR